MPRHYDERVTLAQQLANRNRPQPVAHSNNPLRQIARDLRDGVKELRRIGDGIEDSLDYAKRRDAVARAYSPPDRLKTWRFVGHDEHRLPNDHWDPRLQAERRYDHGRRRANDSERQGTPGGAYYDIDELSDGYVSPGDEVRKGAQGRDRDHADIRGRPGYRNRGKARRDVSADRDSPPPRGRDFAGGQVRGGQFSGGSSGQGYLNHRRNHDQNARIGRKFDGGLEDLYGHEGAANRRQGSFSREEARGRRKHRDPPAPLSLSLSPIRKNYYEDAFLRAMGEEPDNRLRGRDRPRPSSPDPSSNLNRPDHRGRRHIPSLSPLPAPRKPAPRPRGPSLSPASKKRAKQLLEKAKAQDRDDSIARDQEACLLSQGRLRREYLQDLVDYGADHAAAQF